MSFNFNNLMCAPMYNSNNNEIMGYMCSPGKKIEHFTSKISNNGCKTGDKLVKDVCVGKCPTGFTDTSGTLVCSEKRTSMKNTYKPQGPSRNKCRTGDSLNTSTNMCVAQCPRGSVDISNGKCSRPYYSKKQTYPPAETVGSEIKSEDISNSSSSDSCKKGYTLFKDSCVEKCPIGFTDNNSALICSEKITSEKNMYVPKDSNNTCKSGDFFDKSANKCATPCPFGFADTHDGMCTQSHSYRKKHYDITS